MNTKEKIILFFIVAVFTTALASWIFGAYYYLTKPIADFGGSYKEGMLGQPLYINPVLSQTSEVDSGLVQLVYSSIFKYDKSGKLVSDLAESYTVSYDKKVYTIKLKQGVLWHDGEKLTADDVMFTIGVIQDPKYKSPLRQNWKGVTAEKMDDYTLNFKLEIPYFRFLDSLTIGILPRHIWGNISEDRFLLTEYNLKPIGSGPYMFSGVQKDSNGYILTYDLESFPNYFEGKAYISDFSFVFYDDDASLIEAYKNKKVNGVNGVTPEIVNKNDFGKNTNIFELNVPRYFAVFFNRNKSVPLANQKVRKALDLATDKREIVNNVLYGKATCLKSSFLDEVMSCDSEDSLKRFNIEEANKILEEDGWKMGDDGIRAKDDVKLQFDLLTRDWPELSNTALILKDQWKKVGAEVNVQVVSFSDLKQNFIKPRDYDAILEGQAVSFNPDPHYFWHSSQKKDPGFNLAMFENEEADKILIEAREELNDSVRAEKYNRFEEIMIEDSPAVFLYTPKYLYIINKQVRGVELESLDEIQYRFSNVSKWYIKTKRISKNK